MLFAPSQALEHGEAAVDEVAETRETTAAAVALAWVAAQPTVVAPIASARTPEQLADSLPMVDLRLTADELRRLTDASAAQAAVAS